MRRLIITLSFLLLGASGATAGGFSIYEASIRANGLMGAFTAFADHASTIYYNPAGLAGLEGMQIAGGATVIAPRTTFRNLGPQAPAGQETEMVEQNFLVPNFFGSYQVAEGFTAGIGVYAPFGLGTKWPSDWVGRGASIEAEIQTLFANPAIGYTLPDFGIGELKVGAGLMVAFHGEVTLSRAVQRFSPEGTFTLDGSLKEPAFGFNAGLLYQPVERVTLGFTYRSSVTAEFEGEADFDNLHVGFPDEAGGSAEIEMPASWVAALNVELAEGLRAEVDYVWWGWSSYDELTLRFDQSIPALSDDQIVNERNFEDTWQVRGGLEYASFPFEGVTLRAGVAYDNNPIPERYVDPTLPDSDRWLFSGGLTCRINPHVEIDASYIFIRANEREVSGTETGPDGVYNTYAHLPGLGLTLNL